MFRENYTTMKFHSLHEFSNYGMPSKWLPIDLVVNENIFKETSHNSGLISISNNCFLFIIQILYVIIVFLNYLPFNAIEN